MMRGDFHENNEESYMRTKIMKTFEKALSGGNKMRLDILSNKLFRLRIVPAKEDYSESGLNRYGFIQEIAGEVSRLKETKKTDGWEIAFGNLAISYSNGNGEINVRHPDESNSLLRQIGFEWECKSVKVKFAATNDENWIGFGDQTRKRLYHRGHIADCNGKNVKSYIPVPFFMSTQGLGVLVNTTYRIKFDMCASDPGCFFWEDWQGRIDYYIMTGGSFRELLNIYTDLTGKPKLPPEWAFGLWYICRTQADAYEVVNDAYNFRQSEIPCDVIGLEPGWMEKFYDLSVEKKWNVERFPVPPYNMEHNFISALKRMGYKFELWLCNDYDLSYEEERRLTGSLLKHKKDVTTVFHENAEIDEHFKEARYADVITKRNEAWFEHLKKFIDAGADFFKQDGAFQVLEHPDRVWGNGMLDAEMHNLYPLFYSRQMYEGFEKYTNRRPVVFTPSGWTGFQAWCGTWTGDTGGRLDTLGAMLNTSLVGHSWITNDMEVTEIEGIHFGYLQPWSQINSWNYFRMPWIQGAKLTAAHKFYSQLRARLIPYIYSWAYQATKNAYPVMVPLTLEFPEDQDCRNNLHQYLLGRDLMVTVYEHEVYFPMGKWRDFWTGEIIYGPCKKIVEWPENRGGGLYLRSGAIIPLGPLMQFRDERLMSHIELQIFPAECESVFELYEDDGASLKHRDGEFALTRITAVAEDRKVKISLEKTIGKYARKNSVRNWSFSIALDFVPGNVTVNGHKLPREVWCFEPVAKVITVDKTSAPAYLTITE